MSQPAPHEQVASTFDRWAENGRDSGMETEHADVVLQVVALMDVRPGQRILDLGCGNGWGTRLLAQAAPGATAVGIDVSPAMVARAEAAHTNTIRARYEVGRFETLEFRDKSFDRAFSVEALYYAVDLERALAEIARVLKAGGRVDFVLDFYRESPATEQWVELVGLPMHFLSIDEWIARLERAGFGTVRAERIVDRRGPGRGSSDPSDDPHLSEAMHRSGSLWLSALKSS
ncbi:MAG: class I SAM-dependent methyltransferase [Planctomycetota bacterium]|nr:MAG: class I SAM-dependent methyltransferase [Planctomycetota bacterium]